MICPPASGLQLSYDLERRVAENSTGSSRQYPHEGRPAANHLSAGHLSESDDHTDAGLFLVSVSLHPKGFDKVQIYFGGGMSPDFVNDPYAQESFAQLKTLLDKVNVEDKGCTEKMFRGFSSDLAQPGPLPHLERPN